MDKFGIIYLYVEVDIYFINMNEAMENYKFLGTFIGNNIHLIMIFWE